MKHGFNRLISLFLVLCMVLSIVPVGRVSAAEYNMDTTVSGVEDCTVADLGFSVVTTHVVDDNTTAETDPTVSWMVSGDILEGSLVGGTGKRGIVRYRYGATTTITLTNNKDMEALLSFNYDVGVVRTGDTVTVAGTAYTASASENTFSASIPAHGSIDIVLSVARVSQTSKLAENGASITITDLKLIGQGKATVTFAEAENGSYTVTELDASGVPMDTEIAVPGELAVLSTTSYTLSAQPDDGYAFGGWYFEPASGNGKYLSADTDFTVMFADGGTVTPVFITEADGVYGVGEAMFTDLGDAAEAAMGSTEKVVILLKDAALTSDETIPYGVSLMIPYDENHSVNLSDPDSVVLNDEPWVQPTAFRTLTMAEGVVLTVNGSLSVNAPHIACQGGKNNGGAVYKSYAEIYMNADSGIQVGATGNLYAWGYIWGEGAVVADAGATIYEKMQVTDYRGGSNTSTIAVRNMPNAEGVFEGEHDGAFPFNQYYIQNIEVEEILMPGATLWAHASVFLSGEEPVEAAVCFVGTEAAMFSSEGVTVTKKYDPSTDRLVIDVDGDEESIVSLAGITLTMGSLTVNSEYFTLPINGNITININGGTAVVDQELLLQPGTQVNIANGASLATNKNIYIMDADQWGPYVFSDKTCAPIPYSPSLGGASTRNIDSDAVVDINGGMMILNGFYTTVSGAQIISSEETGYIEFYVSSVFDGTVFSQLTGGSTINYIDTVPALLTNGVDDPKFTSSAPADEMDLFYYDADYKMWLRMDADYNIYTAHNVIWVDGDGNEIYNEEVEVAAPVVYNQEEFGTPTKTNTEETTYTFIGWNTDPDAQTALETLPAMANEVTYYAIFSAETNAYQVVWMDADGETVLDIEEYAYGETPEFKSSLTAPSDCYTLSWSPEITKVTGNVTYTAVWTANHTEGDPVTEDEYEGDCVNDGSYDTVIYCSVCGEEMSRETNTVTAPGHGTVLGYEYHEMGDGTHEVFCLDCESVVETVPCTEFENYLCVDCGGAQRHTITFMNGEEEWASTECVHGGTLGIAGMPVPTKENYEFAGWYTEDGEFIYHGITVNGDIVAYATWEPIVALPGSFNGWDTTVKMTKGEDGLYTYQMQLDKGAYEFKVKDADIWLGNNGTIYDTTNGYEWIFSKDEGSNCTLSASGGTYTFTYTPETKGLKVEAVLDHIHAYSEPTFTWSHYYTSCVATAVCDCGDEVTANMTITAANEDGALCFTATGTLAGENVTSTRLAYPADSNAIYFDNSIAKWTEVNAYNWNNADGSSTANWPGVRMTQVEGVEDLYVVIVPDGYDMMIFNNGSVQSNDQTMPTNGANTAVWDEINNIRWGYNEPAQYTISFVVDGETVDTETAYYGQKLDTDALDSIVTKPEKEGYTFSGYDYSNAPEYVNGDITITGSLTAKEYKISMDFNGGMDDRGSTEDEYTFTVATFENVSAVLLAKGEDISRDGYTFAGWTTVKDDASAKIDIDTWLPTEEETTLFALWTENHVHSWTASEYDWADDYSTCTVSAECDCGETTTVTVDSTYEVLKAATCVSPEHREYTAEFAEEWAETQTIQAYDPDEVFDENNHYGTRYRDNGDLTHTLVCVACSNELAAAEPHDNANLIVHNDGTCLSQELNVYECSLCTIRYEVYGELDPDNHETSVIVNEDNGDGTHTGRHPCCNATQEPEPHDYTYDAENHKCSCGDVEEFTLTLYAFQPSGDTGFTSYPVEIQVPYGAVLADYIPETWGTAVILMPGETVEVSGSYYEGIFTITGWSNANTGDMVDVTTATMPAEDVVIQNEFTFTGWCHEYYDFEQDGWTDTRLGTEYLVDSVSLEGWQQIDGEWYYFAQANGGYSYFRLEGLSRATYPTVEINGNTYAPDQETLDYCANKGIEFIDEDEAWFYFGEDGKFQHDYTGIVWHAGADSASWAVNGMLPWHPGMVNAHDVGIGYLIGDTENGGNYAVGGFVNVTRTNGLVAETGVYYFDSESLVLCEYTGITEIDGTLYYFTEGYRLAEGAGLVKVEDDYYYVRSDGKLVVGTTYWVANVNEYTEIAVGEYEFDETGKMIIPEVDPVKDGIYWENDAWFYYQDGALVYGLGLVEITEVWHDGEGDVEMTETVYVRSNGSLARGTYYVTNVDNYTGSLDIPSGTKLQFGNYGTLSYYNHGIVAKNDSLYYYQYNELVYGAGLIQIDGSYYYVRSNGEVVHDRYYWITNTNDTGVAAKNYYFDSEGVLQNPEMVADQLNGIVEVDGVLYYYENGSVCYGAGLVVLEEGVIYVRSNGALAIGKYWVTNTADSGYEQGYYTFGEDGYMIG